MNFSAAVEFLKHFETTRVLTYLQELDIGELIHHPWFLGSMAVLALTALLMRWRLLLITILSITGFVWLVDYTLQRQTTADNLSSDTLLLFAGGGVVIIMMVIYLLFIKSD